MRTIRVRRYLATRRAAAQRIVALLVVLVLAGSAVSASGVWTARRGDRYGGLGVGTGTGVLDAPAALTTCTDTGRPGSGGATAGTGGAAYQAVVDPAVPDPGTRSRTLAFGGARLVVGSDATLGRLAIGITPLDAPDVPKLDAGMTNVTQGPRQGWRFTPHPFSFLRPVEVSLPYDPALVGPAFDPQDVYTFFFDDRAGCWRPLERVSVDQRNHVVVSRTDHFTDVINATVTVPDHPQDTSFNPTQIKNLQAGDPGAGVNLMAPPVASGTGEARLSYPIEVPPGRAGLQPQLSVAYNSAGGDGWLGLGWDLALPAITVDTRWGVPRYDGGLETETYLLDGEQLTPVANRGPPPARSSEKVFHPRVEGSFTRIVRHGTGPVNYSWELVDKSGTHSFYGGTPESTLADNAGDVFQWALREVRDAHGNVMRYHTVEQDDVGVAGGTVPGRNLYLQKITYTGSGTGGAAEGPYAVTFLRDRELGQPRRSDVAIDARGGFKRVTADLLRRIDITLDNLPIRRYDFGYVTGAFAKTLLRSVTAAGEDGQPFTSHTFDYFDDIRDASGAYQAFTPVTWSSPDDGLSNGAVDAVTGGAGQAGAINANTSTSVGGHLYVGFGATPSKSNSVGVKSGFSHTEDTGLLALVDVDGDNLPDKVFTSGGGVVYRKNLSQPGGAPRFSADVRPLSGLPGILSQTSDSLTVGVEGYLGGVAAQLDHVDTFTTTSRYFADVNGDGITDLVDGASVLFGRIGPNGTPVYGVSADTPVPIGSAPVDTTGLIRDLTADRNREIDSHPLVDSVRRWVAPFDGTVQVSGAVHLVPDTSPARAAYTRADGVRVAVQHEDSELWSQRIGPTDYAEHAPAGVDAVPVKRGDRLYFRVQSGEDGAYDQVAWDPQIAYLDTPDSTDANGSHPYRYSASGDFTLGGRATTVTVPSTGTLHLSGGLTVRAPVTDDVTAVVTRDGQTVFTATMPAGRSGDLPLDLDVPVQQGQQLAWRVHVDSPIDVTQLAWRPKATYTAAVGAARLTDAAGNPALFVQPAYDIDMYPVDDLTAAQQSYTAPAAGTLTVDPALAFDFGDQHPDARVVFTVKRHGTLLGKRVITIAGGQVPSDLGLSVPVNAGDDLFFDFSTLDATAATHLTSQSVQVGLDPADRTPAPSAFHSPASTADGGAFPQPYRGWGVVGYNGNRDRAGKPIVQADLAVNPDYRNQLPASVDPARDKDAFAADPKVTPPAFFPFSPAPATARWQAGDLSWANPGTVSSSRLGAPAINLPAAADLANVTAVPRISRSTQISLTGSVNPGVGSIGGSVATGDSAGQLEYLDLNGDGFPDVIGAGGVQYTDPTGQLGGTRGTVPDGEVRRTATASGNASAGSAARTITTGRGYAAPPAQTTANTAQSGNDMPPLGIGGSLGNGSSSGKFDLLDINGDGLPDRVYADGRAALNLGYRFAAPEPWPGGVLNDGSTTSGGVNIGFNTDFYGVAGGASFSSSRSSIRGSLLDVNGDGLADRVFDGNPIQVALNTGAGFAAPRPFLGGPAGVNADVNAQLGGGAYAEFPVCALVITGCVIINPGANFSTGIGRSEQSLRDINGDGYADQLQSTSDGQLSVAENATGRTNLLKTVRRPLGSRIDLDYSRDGNTYDQPQSRWDLSRVAVDDGHPGDGQDVQLTTYRYGGGVYDRLEREFRGYHTVVTEKRDPAAPGEAVSRTSTREYATDSHYTRGLVTRELTGDGAGHPFRETVNTYQMRDVAFPASTADPHSTTATLFPQLVRTDQRFSEGQATPGKSTYTELAYDDVGNLIRSFDAGEAGPGDDVETRIRYTAEDAACRTSNVVGKAKAVDVRGNGVLLRHRESTVNCTTGDLTQHRATLADGTAAVTDLTYFANGNLQSVTNPPNGKGQRYKLTYEYDPALSTHITATTDSFGYRSTAAYNLKYGRVETTTDENNQQVRYLYDQVGRVHTVTGPYETASNHPTIDFEYHPEAAVPYAVTRHIDSNPDGTIRTDSIDSITFTDGLDRVVQTKTDATVSTGPDTPAVAAMVVSGRRGYDFLGRVVEQSYPVIEAKSPLNTGFNPAVDPVPPTRTGYDVLDRPTSTVLPDNTTTTTSYGFGPDRAGTTQFDAAVTDAKGNVRHTYADVRQHTTAVKQANPAGGQPVIWTSYAYDPLGELTGVVDDHNNTTTTGYDNLGRRTVVDNPDTGKTQTGYDLAGNAVKQITANLAATRQAITYDYDFNRLAAVHYPTFPGNSISYSYGAPGAPNNAANRIVTVHDSAGTLTRGYGPLGEVTTETRVVSGLSGPDISYTTRYRYDTWNRVQQMTYPDGEVLSYHYDSGGLVDGATGVKGGFTYPYLARLDYDKFAQRVLMQTGNNTRTTYTYNANDRRLATVAATQSDGTAFENTTYSYDSVGNVTAVADDAPPAGGLGGASAQTFGYDNLYRLTSSQGEYHPASGKTDQYQLTMAYDSINNLASKNQTHDIVSGSSTTSQTDTSYQYTYAYTGRQPHAPTSTGPLDLRYDANGNLTSRTGPDKSQRTQLIWDDTNRLACSGGGDSSAPPAANLVADNTPSCDTSSGKAVRYLYDAQGTRVVKDGGSRDVNIYPNQDYTQHNQTAFKHIFIGNTRLVSKLVQPSAYPENNQFYFHADQLSSTSYGTDNTGHVVEHEQYFPSGESWVDEHTVTPSPYRFTGKEFDTETGLYYYGARYYDPRTSVWQSPDPALGSYLNGTDNGGVFNPTNLAAYSYAGDNPVTRTDPDGRAWLDIDQQRLAEMGHVAQLFQMPQVDVRDGQLNQTLGILFMRAALRSLATKIEMHSEVTGIPDAARTFTSRWRDALTFENKKHQVAVAPDGVGPLIITRVDGETVRVHRAENSLFVEVKTGQDPPSPSTDNWQIQGMIGAIATLSGVRTQPDVVDLFVPPQLIIISTQRPDDATATSAERQGVALYWARLQWDETRSFSDPTVRVGPLNALNGTATRSPFFDKSRPAMGGDVRFFATSGSP
ncbi:MAG: hypothetical protein V7603_643 [Micromonosporaceae bacterium]